MDRRRIRGLAALASLALIAAACGGGSAGEQAQPQETDGEETAADGEDFPTRPINLVVPYPPGGLTDTMSRPLALHAQEEFGEPVGIINRPGGGGTVGIAEVIEGDADGYTLGVASAGPNAVAPHLVDLPYESPDDYEVAVPIGLARLVLVTAPDAPWENMDDFVSDATDRPGEISIGHAGAGSLQDALLHALEEEAGVDFNLVPFEGGGPAITALLGGHVDAITSSEPATKEHVDAGNMKGLGVFSEEQSEGSFAGVPTMQEQGIDIQRDDYLFLVAPSGTPNLDQIADGFKAAMRTDEFQTLADENGFTVLADASREDMAQRVREDYEFYGDLIERLGISQ